MKLHNDIESLEEQSEIVLGEINSAFKQIKQPKESMTKGDLTKIADQLRAFDKDFGEKVKDLVNQFNQKIIDDVTKEQEKHENEFKSLKEKIESDVDEIEKLLKLYRSDTILSKKTDLIEALERELKQRKETLHEMTQHHQTLISNFQAVQKSKEDFNRMMQEVNLPVQEVPINFENVKNDYNRTQNKKNKFSKIFKSTCSRVKKCLLQIKISNKKFESIKTNYKMFDATKYKTPLGQTLTSFSSKKLPEFLDKHSTKTKKRTQKKIPQ